MCEFFSCLYHRTRGILWDPFIDSHSELMQRFGIFNTAERDHTLECVRIEITPPLLDYDYAYPSADKWDFRIDEPNIPSWFEAVATPAEKSVRALVSSFILSSRTSTSVRNTIVLGDAGALNSHLHIENSLVLIRGDMSYVRTITNSRVRISGAFQSFDTGHPLSIKECQGPTVSLARPTPLDFTNCTFVVLRSTTQHPPLPDNALRPSSIFFRYSSGRVRLTESLTFISIYATDSLLRVESADKYANISLSGSPVCCVYAVNSDGKTTPLVHSCHSSNPPVTIPSDTNIVPSLKAPTT